MSGHSGREVNYASFLNRLLEISEHLPPGSLLARTSSVQVSTSLASQPLTSVELEKLQMGLHNPHSVVGHFFVNIQ